MIGSSNCSDFTVTANGEAPNGSRYWTNDIAGGSFTGLTVMVNQPNAVHSKNVLPFFFLLCFYGNVFFRLEFRTIVAFKLDRVFHEFKL